MNENLKTLTFVVAASAVALIAWASNPSLRPTVVEDVRDKLLCPNFKDPQSVASLKIVKYDESLGTIQPFEVAQIKYKGKGSVRWSIPSHDDYPADANDQVASAAVALMGLKILSKVSNNQGDQQEFGVVEPDAKTLKLGATGVGEEIVMADKDGKELLALVFGKEVPDRPGLRYVREVGRSEIYVVQAKTDKFSTKFEDWIEPNLLKIKTIDLQQLGIRDYAIRTTARGLAIIHRGRMQIAYNDAGEPHWTMTNDQKFAGGKWEPVKIAANEELDAAKLDELKTALDDLKIVDVSRKPAGLSADLKVAADFTSNEDALASLQEKGFFPALLEENGPAELFSNEGEIRLDMKDGIEYVLRFGQIAGNGPTAKDAKKKANGKDKDKKSTGVNRYLFVMADFNPNAIPKPKFETYTEPKKDEAKKGDAKKPEVDKKAEDAERARIEKDNKRKQDEYEQQIADGKKHVAELNARFADWYYVISDEVYRKIHLGREEIVVKKTKKEAGKGREGMMFPGQATEAKGPATPISEFEKLKQNGPGAK